MNKLEPREDGKLPMVDLINKINELVEMVNNMDMNLEAVETIVFEQVTKKELDS